MAVSEELYSQSAAMLLNDGTTTSGAVKTIKVSIGTLSTTASTWNAQKAINIINALSPCLNRRLHAASRTVNYYLEEE